MAWWRRKPEAPEITGGLDEQVDTLARAGTVAFGPVGVAATLLPETAAFQALDRAVRSGHVPEADRGPLGMRLQRLVAGPAPAGRIYAATLLDRLDPAAAGAAWRRLADDPAELSTMSGCIMRRTTVGEFAADHRKAGDTG